jgi:hypothetical protein
LVRILAREAAREILAAAPASTQEVPSISCRQLAAWEDDDPFF